MLIAALVSPDRRRFAPWALGLLVLVTVQIALVGARDDARGVAALHPLLGVTAAAHGHVDALGRLAVQRV